MPLPICVVTDSSVQFAHPSFPGRGLVHIVPIEILFQGNKFQGSEELKISSLPISPRPDAFPRLETPSEEVFRQVFSDLGQSYRQIIGIFMSEQLSPVFKSAEKAANDLRGRVNIELIDSQSISTGLGALVEAAAEAAEQGISPSLIEKNVRDLTSRIYSVVCTPGLSYLHHNGFVDLGQARIADMLGLYPIFSIEEGFLTPIEKGRSQRYIYEFFQEFIDEFEQLQHIALLQNVPQNNNDIQMLREHVQECYPQTLFTTHTLNLPIAALFGPKTFGLFVVEAVEKKTRL
ncbi:MAG: DegV family EDD domain-containing protein [Chloroflexi bacterium]|nr:DegV family protein [Anaerolineaceae bacterium]NMB88235.1 DegV family EDD domain-containing protein [Chloroflexota bacterium]